MKLEYRAKDGKLVLIDVVAVKVTDLSPPPTTVVSPPTYVVNTPAIKPEDVKITQWEHQNKNFTKPLVQKYIAKYVEYLREQLGKKVEDWFAQVEFKFWETDPDTVGVDDLVATGEAVSRWVKINVGANAKIGRAFEYLSSESLKSAMIWMQYDNNKLQHIVNDTFRDQIWVPIIIDGVTYNGLKYNNRGLKLGEG